MVCHRASQAARVVSRAPRSVFPACTLAIQRVHLPDAAHGIFLPLSRRTQGQRLIAGHMTLGWYILPCLCPLYGD